MKIHQTIIVIIILAAISLSSCKNKPTVEIASNKDFIQFTQQQFTNTNMQIGNPEIRTIEQTIKTNGHIKTSPMGSSQISVPVPGIVSRLNFAEGEYIQKGATLFALSGREIINIQNQYVKACAQYDFAQQEYERIAKLATEQITARKELISAESTYKIAKAEKNSLAAILRIMNLKPEMVEEGNISANYPIVAPIGGYISSIDAENGQYLETESEAVKIIDNTKLHLALNVFEKDIKHLKSGQLVNFYDPDRKSAHQQATLTSVGRSINQQTKTIPCIAEIENVENNIFINGMYAECEVVVNSDTVNTLPQNSIIRENNKTYVLVKTKENDENIFFAKTEVETGISSSDFIEIKTEGLQNVLVKGTYYYQSQE